MEAEPDEGRVEGWARRTRFTGVVTIFALGLALVLVAPRGTGWLSGVLMAVAVGWYWLPIALRSRRRFAEGYRDGT